MAVQGCALAPALPLTSTFCASCPWPEVQVLEKAECEALGMGLYLGVAEASGEPPKFIHLTYTPQGEPPQAV